VAECWFSRPTRAPLIVCGNCSWAVSLFLISELGYCLDAMGLSGRDNLQGPQSRMPGWHRFLACLAICTLLIQSIVPELAMAARDARALQAMAAETYATEPFPGHSVHEAEGHGAKKPRRQPAHSFHDICPFCFVQSIQVLPSGSGGELAPPPAFSLSQVRVRCFAPVVTRQFLTCLHPRAPPYNVRG
jgi:hypothetical protein